MKLWVEGHAATGTQSNARYLGDFEADTLREAAERFKSGLRSESDRNLVDLQRMTYWGCRFFDNETDARKSFG